MAKRAMGKKGGFPLGLLLLAAGGYLLYKRSQGQPLLPGDNTATVSDARTYIQNWAMTQFGHGSPQLQWAQTAPEADIVRLSNVIHVWAYQKPDGTSYGYCPSSGPGTYPQCYADWQYIKSKYPSVFGVINY